MKIHQKYIILFIALVTITTRFIGLDKIPPHLSNDEISIAYDAYSVSQTQRDEHNEYLPLSFKSHNARKAPLTAYLTIIPTALFGNSEYSARLASAILGSLTVAITGFITWELTKNKKLALLSSFFLAISPWHIASSRMILESNIALFFTAAGLYLFLHAVNNNKNKILTASFAVFALSLYGYHTQWGLIPILILALIFHYRKVLLGKRAFYLGIVLFFLLTIPLGVDYLNSRNDFARASNAFITNEPGVNKRLEQFEGNSVVQAQIIIESIFGSYSSYNNPRYLFFNGLALLPESDPFQIGLFLAPLLPLFFAGLFFVRKYFKENTNLMFAWLIASPFIPAITAGGANSVRNLVSVVPYTIVISAGAYGLYKYFQAKKEVVAGYSALIFISFAYFVMIYFYHFPKENGVNFQYGYKQIAQHIKPVYGNYEKIIVDPKFGAGYFFDGVPHLYLPYFTSLDPQYLLDRKANDPCGHCFAKYEIRSIKWHEEEIKKNYLYIVPYSNKPDDGFENNLIPLHQVNLPNNQPAFVIYEMNKAK